MPKLWIVMPAYNEEACVSKVVLEWLDKLRLIELDFMFCILNDGSTDSTLNILKNLSEKNPEIYVVDKPNSGHGQTCLLGYKKALEKGAEWVFQIDSDGQCDPMYFDKFWQARLEHSVIYGYRKHRGDGLIRFLISRVVSLVTWLGTGGVWVADANVPYRLMRRDTLMDIVNKIPSDFLLVNILVAALHKKYQGIKWMPIYFRERYGGISQIKGMSFVKHGLKLFRQLVDVKQLF